MESRYHLIQGKVVIADAFLQRVAKEESCRKGEQRINQDYGNYREWY